MVSALATSITNQHPGLESVPSPKALGVILYFAAEGAHHLPMMILSQIWPSRAVQAIKMFRVSHHLVRFPSCRRR
jgi:hypothetical protein